MDLYQQSIKMSLQKDVDLLKRRIDEIERELARLKLLYEDIATQVKPVQLPALLMRINAEQQVNK